MSVFTDSEIAYMTEQKLGRLATVGPNGKPHVVPVTFRYNPTTDTIDIGGHDFPTRKKWRDVQQSGLAAFVIDDVLPPWKPRMIEVRGRAETLDEGGREIMNEFSPEIIRIHPERIVSGGIADGQFSARTVGS